MQIVQFVSIGFEVIAAVLGVLLAVQKKKPWGWLVALTFAIYVYYDLSNLLNFSVSLVVLRGLFFIASLAILWALWRIYREAP